MTALLHWEGGLICSHGGSNLGSEQAETEGRQFREKRGMKLADKKTKRATDPSIRSNCKPAFPPRSALGSIFRRQTDGSLAGSGGGGQGFVSPVAGGQPEMAETVLR